MSKRTRDVRAEHPPPLSLHSLSTDEALRSAMQTGRPPASKKRTATRRRLTEGSASRSAKHKQ